MRVLVVGPGYVGGEVAALLAASGHTVRALRRSPGGVPGDPDPIRADVTRPLEIPAEPFDRVVYAVSPSERSEAAYRAAYRDGPRHVLDWLGWTANRSTADQGRFLLVSSTGVYGYDDGRWVDEATDPKPSTPTGRVILDAERSLLERRPSSVVLRLGGIYGPGRTRTIERVRSGDMPCPPAGLYGNRIHRDDAAGAVVHLLSLARPHHTWLGVDSDPAELREVYAWIADRTGTPDPCSGGTEELNDAPERRGTNKRCDGTRLTESGYRLVHSTFREGYGSLLHD